MSKSGNTRMSLSVVSNAKTDVVQPENPPPPQFIGAHGVEPSPWIVELPFFIRALIMYFFVDILRPGENFITVLRKLVLTVGTLLCFSPSTVSIYNCFTVDSSSAAALDAKISVFFFMPAWITPYLIVRFTEGRDELAADIWVFGTWLLVTLIGISFMDWPLNESFVMIVVIAQLFRTRLMPVQIILCVLSHIMSSFNAASFAQGEPEYTLWALPGAIMRGFPTRMLFNMASLGTCFLGLTALQLQLMESDRQTKVSRASADFAQQVAELLGNYDTKTAKQLIEAAKREKECNPELINSMKVLIANLDKYRPHLPNWLLPQSDGDDDVLSHSAVRDESFTSDRRSDDLQHSARRQSHAASKSDGEKQHQGRFVDGGWLAPCVAQTAQISMAYIEYAFTNKDRAQEAANEWVQWVHREAAATSGAVHSFVGDVVVMSWNAASRAIQNEVKAARLLARAAVYGRDNGVALSGAAMSGTARVQLAGGERMQALTIHAGWKRVATEPLLKLARDTKAMLVDHRTRSNSHFGIRYRAACALMVRETSHGDGGETVHRVGAFEVMGEASDEGDEWMYVMQKNTLGGTVNETEAVKREQTLAAALQDWGQGEDIRAVDALAKVATVTNAADLPSCINALCRTIG